MKCFGCGKYLCQCSPVAVLDKPRSHEQHNCPEWGEYLGLTISREPHGEVFEEHLFRCTVCGWRWSQ